ncbi:MAG: hypothetical protein WC146_00155 [Patescibacteria group bacterium]|jgi:hypothetical protein
MAYSNFYARLHDFKEGLSLSLSAIWRFQISRFYLLIIGIFQVIAWLEAFYLYRRLAGGVLIEHYNVDFGVDLIGDPSRVFLYPLFGLAVLFLNLSFAAWMSEHKDFRIFIHLLFAAALTFGIFICLSLFFLYLINFR